MVLLTITFSNPTYRNYRKKYHQYQDAVKIADKVMKSKYINSNIFYSISKCS